MAISALAGAAEAMAMRRTAIDPMIRMAPW
jgi:hypothetical protein